MTTAFHWLNAIAFLGLGLYCTGWARRAAATLGISFVHEYGLTDFRATYGGMCLAAGLFFFMAALGRSIPLDSATWLSFVLYLSLGVTRIYGIMNERPSTKLMAGFLTMELLLAGLSGWLLLLSASAES